jgi:hypothetical protein
MAGNILDFFQGATHVERTAAVRGHSMSDDGLHR